MSTEPTSQKAIILLSTGCLLAILLLTALMVIDLNQVQSFHPIQVSAEHPVQWSLEPAQYGSHHITLTGWALIEGELPVKYDLDVVLQDRLSGEFLEIPTTLAINEDLDQVFPDDLDYSHSGFLAKINRDKLNLEQSTYRVYLDYRNNDHHYFIYTGSEISGQP